MKIRIFIFSFCVFALAIRAQIVTTFAGSDSSGYSGDGGPATLARLDQPQGLATDAAGNVYVADAGNNVIRKIDISTGIITTVAGTGYGAGTATVVNNFPTNSVGGYSGDGGPATSAELFLPFDVAVDASGNLYIADAANYVVRKVNTAGIISTVAGNHFFGYGGNYGPATSARLTHPMGVALDKFGNFYISDVGNEMIREVFASTGIIKRIAGGNMYYPGNGQPALQVALPNPQGIEADAAGNIYIATVSSDRIHVIDASGIINTVAGISNNTIGNGYGGDGGPAVGAQLNLAQDIVFDAVGNMYIADTWNYIIRKIDTSGIIHLFAGTPGVNGHSGDGGLASAALFRNVEGITMDKNCNLYISDGNKIRKIALGQTFSDSATTTNVVCGSSLGSLTVTPPSGGYPPYTYNIGHGPQSNNTFDSLYAGAYSYTITNSLGCQYTPSKTFTVSETDSALASFYLQPDTACTFQPINFGDSSRASSFQWTINGSVFTDKNPSYYFTSGGSYDIKLTVYLDPGHCSDSMQRSVTVMDCPNDNPGIVPTNIFTPNGDGINDFWQPVIYDYNFNLVSYHCAVYDRWGLKVFETEDVHRGWNGKTTSGSNCSEGTYFYVMDVSGSNFLNVKKINTYRGFVQLSR